MNKLRYQPIPFLINLGSIILDPSHSSPIKYNRNVFDTVYVERTIFLDLSNQLRRWHSTSD